MPIAFMLLLLLSTQVIYNVYTTLQDIGVKVTHIESREPLLDTGFGFYIGCKVPLMEAAVVKQLAKVCCDVKVTFDYPGRVHSILTICMTLHYM